MLHNHHFLLAWSTFIIILFAAPVVNSADADIAANWVVETENGQRMSLNDEIAKGHKVVTIFWATWCRYCRELLPKVNALQKRLDNDVTFIALNIWEDNDPVAYMKKNNLNLPTALRAEAIAYKYGLKGTPGVFVIGEGNKILYQRRTGQSADDVINNIEMSLKH